MFILWITATQNLDFSHQSDSDRSICDVYCNTLLCKNSKLNEGVCGIRP